MYTQLKVYFHTLAQQQQKEMQQQKEEKRKTVNYESIFRFRSFPSSMHYIVYTIYSSSSLFFFLFCLSPVFRKCALFNEWKVVSSIVSHQDIELKANDLKWIFVCLVFMVFLFFDYSFSSFLFVAKIVYFLIKEYVKGTRSRQATPSVCVAKWRKKK